MSSQPVCMAGKAGVLREKHYKLLFIFLFHLIIHFLLLDNSIAYMFIHTPHAYAHILLHKMDGSKRNINYCKYVYYENHLAIIWYYFHNCSFNSFPGIILQKQ